MSTSAGLRKFHQQRRHERDLKDATEIFDYIIDDLGGSWSILQVLERFPDALLKSYGLALGWPE